MQDGLPRSSSKITELLNAAGADFRRGNGDLVERTFVVTARRFHRALLNLVDDLIRGSIDLQSFSRRSSRILRDGLGISYSLGALSVDPFHTLTIRDIRIINRELEEERRFFRAFGRDIDRGFVVLNPFTRAGLYLQATRGMFELGRMEAAPPGPYEWVLGPTEHCRPCFLASQRGPYQKDNLTHMGLEVLPGIPGSGDVCNGLTSCGCYLRLVGMIPLPNEDLQRRLREIVAEIVHDNSFFHRATEAAKSVSA